MQQQQIKILHDEGIATTMIILVMMLMTMMAAPSNALLQRSCPASSSLSRRRCQSSQLAASGKTARNGLSYEDVEIGTGRNIFPGDTIVCYYIGLYYKTSSSSSTVNRQSDEDDSTTNPFSAAAFSSFKNRNQGKKIIFDETEPGDPAKVLIGKRTVIRGWDLGICGNRDLDIAPMKIGGERVLRIPAPLAYGQEGSDVFGIPPSTPLEFQIAIVDAQKDLENGVSTAMIQKGILGLGITLLLILGIVATFSQNMTMVYRFLKVDGSY